jgi:hypothetical protein
MRPAKHLTFLGALFVASSAAATETPGFFDVSETSASGIVHNRLSFQCQTLSRGQIECTMAQAFLREPTNVGEGKKASATALLRLCREKIEDPRPPASRQEIDFASALKAACLTRDIDGIRSVFSKYVDEVEAQTCDLLTVSFRHVFSRVDENTWTRYEADNSCHTGLTGTIWRKPGETGWSYTEAVTLIGPSVSRSTCATGPHSSEWTWQKAVTPYETKCRYLRW